MITASLFQAVRCVYASLIFVLVFTLSLQGQGTSTAQQQSQPQQQVGPPVEITIAPAVPVSPEDAAKDRQLMNDQVNQMIGVPLAEQQSLNNAITYIRQYMNPAEVTFLESIGIRIFTSDEINAFSRRYPLYVGRPIVAISTGLYKYLDFLVAMDVIGREHNARACVLSYDAYLVMKSQSNAAKEKRAHALGFTDSPEEFAAAHLDTCPKITTEQLLFVKSDKASYQYSYAMIASLMFVTLHEMGHIAHGDADRDLKTLTLEQRRQQETAADDYALQFMMRTKASPLMAMPVMFLAAERENFSDPQGDHPPSVVRAQVIVEDSKRVITSKTFRKWLNSPWCN
jgi:hypothetical protein